MGKKFTIIIAIVIISLGFLFLIFNKLKTPGQEKAMTIAPKNSIKKSIKPIQSQNTIVNSEDISVENPNVIGNTPQNIFLGSVCTEQDNFLYYISNEGINRVMKDGRTGYKNLYKGSCKCINVSGKYIYFIDITNCYLCSMDLNGENVKYLRKGVFSSLVSYKDKIYFIEKDLAGSTEKDILYSMDTNGNSIETLISGVNKFTICKDKIIYNKKYEYYLDNIIYTSDLYGKSEKIIAKIEDLRCIGICNDAIISCYFTGYNNIVVGSTDILNGKYNRFNVNIGTTNFENESVVILSNSNNTYLLVTLYAQGSGQNSILYKLDLNNKTLKKVLDDVNYFTSNFDDTTQEKNSVNLSSDRIFISGSLSNQLVDMKNNTPDNSIPLY